MALTQENLPGVSKVRKDFQVREDSAFAQHLQEQEFEEHFEANVQLRRTAKVDSTVAERIQAEEKERFEKEEQRRKEQLLERAREDEKHAAELLAKIKEEEDIQLALKMQDEMIAKQLLQKEAEQEAIKKQRDEKLAKQLYEEEMRREALLKEQMLRDQQLAKDSLSREQAELARERQRQLELSESEIRRLEGGGGGGGGGAQMAMHRYQSPGSQQGPPGNNRSPGLTSSNQHNPQRPGGYQHGPPGTLGNDQISPSQSHTPGQSSQPRPMAPQGQSSQPRPMAPQGQSSQPRPMAPQGQSSQPRPMAPQGQSSQPRPMAPQGQSSQPRPMTTQGQSSQPRPMTTQGQSSQPRPMTTQGQSSQPRPMTTQGQSSQQVSRSGHIPQTQQLYTGPQTQQLSDAELRRFNQLQLQGGGASQQGGGASKGTSSGTRQHAPGHPSPRLVPSDHGTGEEDMDEQALQERRDAAFAMMLQDCEGPLPHHDTRDEQLARALQEKESKLAQQEEQRRKREDELLAKQLYEQEVQTYRKLREQNPQLGKQMSDGSLQVQAGPAAYDPTQSAPPGLQSAYLRQGEGPRQQGVDPTQSLGAVKKGTKDKKK